MKKLHFIAVAGTGMGSAAGVFSQAGYEVRGSDEAVYPPMSDVLRELGIATMTPFSAENLAWRPDLAVVGNICRYNHTEVLAAQERGVPLTSFPALLGQEILAHRTALVVAGTHGKTTTSTMLAWLLREAGLEPGWLIGGVPRDLPSGFHLGRGGGPFVLEGDEYDTAFFDKNPKFVRYRPKAAIVTGVEFDHADIYDSLETVIEQFHRLASLVPPSGLLLLCADNTVCRKIAAARGNGLLYGLEGDPDCDYQAINITSLDEGGFSFGLAFHGKSIGEFTMGLTGSHNLRNMTGALALAHSLGASVESLQKSVASFRGVKRRQEVLGEVGGITVMDDFGHHPTAVALTLEGMQRKYQRIVAVFEPRSATSRRKVFQDAYVEAFS
ncbi:hypothetical protein KJ865_08865, partial [Myxococcota bacterium]|nr:hypothetical protein [Myxococcota bacterium]